MADFVKSYPKIKVVDQEDKVLHKHDFQQPAVTMNKVTGQVTPHLTPNTLYALNRALPLHQGCPGKNSWPEECGNCGYVEKENEKMDRGLSRGRPGVWDRICYDCINCWKHPERTKDWEGPTYEERPHDSGERMLAMSNP